MALRLLETIESVQYLDPDYDGYLPLPRVGELLPMPGGGVWHHILRFNCKVSTAFRALLTNMPGTAVAGYVPPLVPKHKEGSTTAVLRPIKRLNPNKLVAEDLIDLSGFSQVRIRPDAITGLQDALCVDYTRRDGPYRVFPLHTFGFMYFHRHPDLICSELRFRVMPASNEHTFDAGHDLLLPNGLPWTQRMTRKSSAKLMFQDILIRDQLLTAKECRIIVENMPGDRATLRAMGDVLLIKMSSSSLRFNLGKECNRVCVNLTRPWLYATIAVKYAQENDYSASNLAPLSMVVED
jgi:hypothetical protein